MNRGYRQDRLETTNRMALAHGSLINGCYFCPFLSRIPERLRLPWTYVKRLNQLDLACRVLFPVQSK